MAKISKEILETIWNLKRELLNILEESTALEYSLFANFGETSNTQPFLEELKSISERTITWFNRLSNTQLRITEAQPTITPDMLEFVYKNIERIQLEIPALKRSIEEVKMEWT